MQNPARDQARNEGRRVATFAAHWRGRCAQLPLVAAVLACAVVAGCHGQPRSRVGSTPLDADAGDGAEASYMSAPQVSKSAFGRNGAILLNGHAEPGAAIRLQAPEGDVSNARAGRDGRWSLRMPAVARPRMFALSAQIDQRVVHAEGALLLLPAPSPAALLVRAGAGSLVMEGDGSGPRIAAVDYDPAGFVAVSGVAAPDAPVRLTLDGAPSGLSRADADGRYAVLAAGRELSFRNHVAMVQTPAGVVQRDFRLTTPTPLSSPYQATAEADGWRVEWAPSGGGVQSTLVFDAHAPATHDRSRS